MDCQLVECTPEILIRHYRWRRDHAAEETPAQLNLF